MDLPNWWSCSDKEQHQKLATQAGYSFKTLKKQTSLCANGSQMSQQMAHRLSEASVKATPGKEMTFKELRPDLFEKYKQQFSGKGIAA